MMMASHQLLGNVAIVSIEIRVLKKVVVGLPGVAAFKPAGISHPGPEPSFKTKMPVHSTDRVKLVVGISKSIPGAPIEAKVHMGGKGKVAVTKGQHNVTIEGTDETAVVKGMNKVVVVHKIVQMGSRTRIFTCLSSALIQTVATKLTFDIKDLGKLHNPALRSQIWKKVSSKASWTRNCPI